MPGENVNYKELYFKMVRASEEALRVLIRAQQECEERYLAVEASVIECKDGKEQ